MAGISDRVCETSTTTGTGAFTLDGAVAGYQTFDAAFDTGVDNYIYYVIEGTSGACAGQWATGSGYLSDGTTLERDDGVDFAAGTKRVFCSATALYLENGNPAATLIANTNLRFAVGFNASTSDDTETALTGSKRAGDFDPVAVAESFETETGRFYCLKATVTAFDSANGDAAFFDISALFSNTAGTAAVIGTPTITTVHATAGAAAWAVDVDVSGALIVVNVTGAAATSIAWGGGGVLYDAGI
jgi:hypothetical protein